MKHYRSIISATGSYLPKKVLSNQDIEKIVETSDEWITQRSGIKQRHIADENETTADMAVAAANDALTNSNISCTEIDGIIVATTTPDRTFPAVATKVQAELGIPACMAFDVQAVCSGFIYALSVADNFIKSGQANRILVIGADKMSALLNWKDRTTCVLFGDGAGAVILESNTQDEGILSTHLYANGRQRDLLYTNGGASSTGTAGHIVMEGQEVFKNAIKYSTDLAEETLTKNNISSSEIDWLVPHQANRRIIEAMAKKLELPMEKVILTVNKHGNTSAASIPLAFHEGITNNKIKRGDLLLLEAMGGGMTWGSALLRY